MKLSQLGEFGIISRIQRATPKGPGVLLGIGDDAAWIRTRTGSCLITADLLLERIHFQLGWTSLYELGHKSLAVNLSDIAAMGGIPAYLILSLGVPPTFSAADIDEFYRGIRSLASKTGVSLVGGDTNAADALVISVCVIGHAVYRPITRSGAKTGDDIYVTGTLGDSALALKLLMRKTAVKKDRAVKYLLCRHHRPTPRLRAGALLAKENLARAMIDVSDGLLQDLGHLCKASGVGALILEESLPLSPAYRSLAAKDGTGYALSGGEDYELLFCVRRKDRSRMEKIKRRLEVPITHIGQCVDAGRGVQIIDGNRRPLHLPAGGHDHFKQ
ncbi:MAG: thiamine-phosphate kinase [Candidatus Binatia bacterium]